MQREKVKLTGEIELDEYYLNINLKGTRPENMPRISKPRKSNGKGKRGITNHDICIISGVDENDNMYFEVGGTGEVTINMIRSTIALKITNHSKVEADCKSSYESGAKENNWNLIQIKAKGHTDCNGNNLANINSLHSELTLFLAKFHGVSTEHLQEYLDWFVFRKYQNYSIEYLEQEADFEKKTITKFTDIKFSNVCDNHSIFDFFDIYNDYNYCPSNSTT